MRLTDIGAIRALSQKYGFSFYSGLGQNFLINPSVCPRMAEAALPEPGMPVLEVGPGIGVLTHELCLRAHKVAAIEIDSRLIPVLRETLAEHENLTLIKGDVLELDLPALFEREFPGEQVTVCANLPYYITTPVIMKFLESGLPVRSLVVMVQREAADRLIAKPGQRASGAISAAVWYRTEPRRLFSVQRGSFMPQPNVDSAVIELHVRENKPSVADEALLFRTVAAAFGQRRKTAHNAVAAGLGLSKEAVAAALSAAGIPPRARAENIPLEGFIDLSDALASRAK
jgi:16S rRNA (adenine1518-N6/adenine1519-N6)-dimethyltransferase